MVIDIVGSVSLESGNGPGGGTSILFCDKKAGLTVLILAREVEDKVLRG